MKANFPFVVALLALASCAAPPKPAPAPAPVPALPRPVAPTPPPLPKPPADWRDAPQTPGVWSWSMVAGRSTAVFGQPGAAPVTRLVCDRGSGQILLSRTGSGEGHVAMALTTSTGTRPLLSEPLLSQPGWLTVPLRTADPILDSAAFSRGRFAFEAAGMPTLYIPAWPEMSRVIEDCR